MKEKEIDLNMLNVAMSSIHVHVLLKMYNALIAFNL